MKSLETIAAELASQGVIDYHDMLDILKEAEARGRWNAIYDYQQSICTIQAHIHCNGTIHTGDEDLDRFAAAIPHHVLKNTSETSRAIDALLYLPWVELEISEAQYWRQRYVKARQECANMNPISHIKFPSIEEFHKWLSQWEEEPDCINVYHWMIANIKPQVLKEALSGEMLHLLAEETVVKWCLASRENCFVRGYRAAEERLLKGEK